MIRNKIQALWFDHKPVWKAHRKIFELENAIKKEGEARRDLEAANSRLRDELYTAREWSSYEHQDLRRTQELVESLRRTVGYLCRGYDALATALIARGGDPNQVHPEAPPADR